MIPDQSIKTDYDDIEVDLPKVLDRYRLLPKLGILGGVSYIVLFLYPFRFIGSGEILHIFGAGLFVSSASLLTGGLIGILFGIPRTPTTQHPDGTEVQPAVSGAWSPVIHNDNLVQISDWLAKIIVGVGLVELSSIPPKLGLISRFVSPGLRPSVCSGTACSEIDRSAQVAALAIIISFLMMGFIFGYVWARLYFFLDLREAVKQEAIRIYKRKAKEVSIRETGELAEVEGFLERGQLDSAREIIDRLVEGNPSDGRFVLTKARVLARQAKRAADEASRKALLEDALHVVDSAIKLMPTFGEPLYNKACYQALLGFSDTGFNINAVIENLRAAFALNSLLRVLAETDEDLDSVRQGPQFKALMEEVPSPP